MSVAGASEWMTFAVLVGVLLALDVGYASRGAQVRSVRKAWAWSGLWIAVALAFGLWIWIRLGREPGLDYLTAYFVEKSLSVDNLVVFALVFSQTGVPPALQRRVLFWGVLGALVMRALLIATGVYLLQRFHWVVYPFSALLLYAAVRMLRSEAKPRLWVDTTCTLCTSWVGRFIPITAEQHGERFTVRLAGRRYATPVLVALVAIESADLVFAVDSIPAVFAITRDPFLVYTSNVFALLGLRSLYAVIGDVFERFSYLRMGLAALLVFVAVKLALSDLFHIPSGVSLAIIAAILGVAAAASRLLPDPRRKQPAMVNCAHRDRIRNVKPADNGCTKCKALGDSWVQLRMCMTCGHVGCCDSSKNKHATAHFHESGHPIIRSLERGEHWKWCYVDQAVIENR
jgi:tellurite resistance protein TerC